MAEGAAAWTCSACTFMNHNPMGLSCNVCSSARTRADRPNEGVHRATASPPAAEALRPIRPLAEFGGQGNGGDRKRHRADAAEARDAALARELAAQDQKQEQEHQRQLDKDVAFAHSFAAGGRQNDCTNSSSTAQSQVDSDAAFVWIDE